MEVKGVAKNPLAIIALFISFMYGSASLILGTAVEKLDAFNERALVIFLVAFPLLILLTFLFLVVFHHRKLYAPGDFRSDESFLAGVATISGPKGLEESDGEEPPVTEDEPAQIDDNQVLPLPVPKQEPATEAADGSAFRDNLRLAESLAADLYQKRFGGLLKRDVQFVAKDGTRFVFDFAIEVKDTVYVAEVKYIRGMLISNVLNMMLGKFLRFDAARIAEGVRFIKVAIVVLEDRPEFAFRSTRSSDSIRRVREMKNENLGPDVIVEGFTMTELLRGGPSETGAPA